MVAAIQLEYDPTAATASVTDSLPAFDDTAPHCSMALTDLAQPDDDTHNLMRVAQDIPSQTAATVWPLVAYDDGVPYRKDGITDWSQVDDDLSASTIKGGKHTACRPSFEGSRRHIL